MLPLYIFSMCLWYGLVEAITTVNIDDQSPLINYSPGWVSVQDTLDAGGGHMVSKTTDAVATITFTFRNMYFMSTRWHYHVGAVIVVDGQRGVADMQDYTAPPDLDTKRATVPSSVVWSYKGDETKRRTIAVSVPPGDELTVVDMFVFEVDDDLPATPRPTATVIKTLDPSPPIDTTSSLLPSISPPLSSSLATSLFGPPLSLSSPQSSSSISSSSAPSSPPLATDTSHQLSNQAKSLIISLSVVGAAFLALLIFFLYWLCVRKASKKPEEVEKAKSLHDPDTIVADGKSQASQSGSMGQASNAASTTDVGSDPPAEIRENVYTSTTAMIPPPERRPTVIARPIPANLHRNPTTASVQHGLDLPPVPHSNQAASHDAPDIGAIDDA